MPKSELATLRSRPHHTTGLLYPLVALVLLTVGLRAVDAQPLQLVAANGGTSAVTRALMVARAEKALVEARRDYTRSGFQRCASRLQGVEMALRARLSGAEDLALLKRVHLWLGLCLAVGDQPIAARRVFLRANRLPGPDPDVQVFPPQVMELYQGTAVSRSLGTCSLSLERGRAGVQLDGRTMENGAPVVPGEHYVLWQEGGPRSALVELNPPDCRLTLPVFPAATGGPVLESAELSDAQFLSRVGQVAGVDTLWFVKGGGVSLRLGAFDVNTASFKDHGRPAAAPSSGGRRDRGEPSGPEPVRWYKRWWVWTLVGVAVGAAVALPVTLTRKDHYELVF